MKTKISACLVVHNEEKKIGQCLESLKDLVDEILVVHDGPCLDNTVKICKRYGSKVYIREFKGNPACHKAWLLEKAANDWIFQIDADEKVSDLLRSEIENLNFDKDGYWIKIPSEKDKLGVYHLRLYNRRKIKFIGLLHGEAQLINPKNSQLLKNPIYHLKDKEKSTKWITVNAKEYLKDFSEIPKYNWPENDWPKNIKFRRDHPFLSLFLAPLRTFFHFSKKYNLYIGLRQTKYSLLLGIKIIDLKYRKYLYFLKYKLISFFLNIFEYFHFLSQRKKEKAYVILTFDDEIKKEHKKLIDFLNESKIRATFFIPFSKITDELVNYLYSNNHEIGWHGYWHQRFELRDSYKNALSKSSELIKKLGVVSVRLPFLVKKKDFFENLKSAGFKIDSSYPTFTAFSKIKLRYNLKEAPFLRLPDFGSMDLDFKKYSDIKKQILRNIKPGKITVIGFHIYKQYEYLDEFKNLIKELLSKNIKFLTLKDLLMQNEKNF